MNDKEHSIFLKHLENDVKYALADLEYRIRQVDIGNNACFSSPDSRESIRKRLNLILAQFEEKNE
jgi:hypothetical protein